MWKKAALTASVVVVLASAVAWAQAVRIDPSRVVAPSAAPAVFVTPIVPMFSLARTEGRTSVWDIQSGNYLALARVNYSFGATGNNAGSTLGSGAVTCRLTSSAGGYDSAEVVEDPDAHSLQGHYTGSRNRGLMTLAMIVPPTATNVQMICQNQGSGGAGPVHFSNMRVTLIATAAPTALAAARAP